MKRQTKALTTVCAFLILCCTVSGGRNDSWIEVRSPHFTVASNADEQQARRIANQFEEIRAVFQSHFPSLRVDSGKPLTVIAVKDEASLKALLPDFWTVKDARRPSGRYQEGTDENFALLRTDIGPQANPLLSPRDVEIRQTENPYSAEYEEYTYAILRWNFSSLPLWLTTGLGQFYGSTIVEGFKTDVGRVSRGRVALLQRSQLIPIDQLMRADTRSPLYSDRDRYEVFYAECWAIVHYLTLDPEGSKGQPIEAYFKAWDETGDAVEAAQRTLGDLKKFQTNIDNYSRRVAFLYLRGDPQARLSPQDFTSRPMSPAEALVVQADFLEHSAHANDARPMLKAALEMQPDLAKAHACMGYDSLVQYNNDDADKEFKQATVLDPQDFRSLYYRADVVFRKAGYTAQSTPQIIDYLEKVVQLNPNFAPAYAFLSVAYLRQPQTKEKALGAALKAHQLEPGMVPYFADIGDALIALDRDADARAISEKLNKVAVSPQQKATAQGFANRLAQYEQSKQHGNN
jgi:tetratricopeptide (TPR) repeat protein